MTTDFDGRKLDLEFPCSWSYTIFGADQAVVRAAVESVVSGLEHSLFFSHASTEGNYCSMHLELSVASDDQRLAIFRALHEHPDIHYVL